MMDEGLFFNYFFISCLHPLTADLCWEIANEEGKNTCKRSPYSKYNSFYNISKSIVGSTFITFSSSRAHIEDDLEIK